MKNYDTSVFPTLIGNRQLKNTLSSDIAESKSAHAYILEGKVGSGKRTAAREICAALLCENKNEKSGSIPCHNCSQCRKVFSGHSVDVLTVSNRDKATIGVDMIREINKSLYITPNDSDRKVYVIENAHLMTHQAQNALLKSLEEPPPYVMFILLCETATLLLETVRSRAPVIKMELFPDEFITELLHKEFPNEQNDNISYASRLAGGSIGLAKSLLSDESSQLKLYKAAGELVSVLLSDKKSEAITFVLQSIPKERVAQKSILSLSHLALRDLIAVRKGGKLVYYGSSESIPKCAKNISVKKIIDLDTLITEAEAQINANCSQSTVFTSLVMSC